MTIKLYLTKNLFLKHRYHASKPLLGGVNTTACAKAVNTDCSARPILNFPAKDLKEAQVYRVVRKYRGVLNYVHNYLSIKRLSPFRASHLCSSVHWLEHLTYRNLHSAI